jgi:subtilisin family serine protease
MAPLDLVNLAQLMDLSGGRPDIVVGLIDGPIVIGHADLAAKNIREAGGEVPSACTRASSAACLHGTFVAGVLCARRGSAAPAICPDCTLLVRPVFMETAQGDLESPNATPEELATAIVECVEAGARVLNLSLALIESSPKAQLALLQALDFAARRGVIIVAAAGNQGWVGATIITGHASVIPVAACDARGMPLAQSNLGHSIGRRGLLAPGEQVTSLGANGPALTLGGTSVAAPFVTGAVALLWSLFPAANGASLRSAFQCSRGLGRRTVTPPLLNAWAAYQLLTAMQLRR